MDDNVIDDEEPLDVPGCVEIHRVAGFVENVLVNVTESSANGVKKDFRRMVARGYLALSSEFSDAKKGGSVTKASVNRIPTLIRTSGNQYIERTENGKQRNVHSSSLPYREYILPDIAAVAMFDLFCKSLKYLPVFFILSAGFDWLDVPCNEKYQPENCDIDISRIDRLPLDVLDRCGPALLEPEARNYFLGVSGRGITYKENMEAYRRVKIVPKVMQGVANTELETTVFRRTLDFPIGLSPIGLQRLAHYFGEIATAAGVTDLRTVMIISSYTSIPIEDLEGIIQDSKSQYWMQLYMFKKREITRDLIQKAVKAGVSAFVLTVDTPVLPTLTCNAGKGLEDLGV
ncbi:cytochrome b2, mitochondrial-like, partial [Stegodyphus dumicola]|uniref:cytochrome b2, mitochondrial-like n=1 Tax=Stegodyphus dumicola TaxID=202533 RepID=UPI0015AA8AE9